MGAIRRFGVLGLSILEMCRSKSRQGQHCAASIDDPYAKFKVL